jgi:outer membrane cobalamin receptor
MRSSHTRRVGDEAFHPTHARTRVSSALILLCVRRRLAALTLGIAFSVPVFTRAQEAYRQTIVVTAATTPVELGSVTRAMTVISRETIAVLPARTIADVLRLSSSVDVRARGIRGVQTDFALRGATFGQMLVLVDGVRLNDAQSGHHNGDIPVPLAAVERIEILQGPGSSLFGADALGGTINIITRTSTQPALVLEGGSFGRVGGNAQADLGAGTIRHTVAVSLDRSSGFMYDRDFATASARLQTRVGDRTRLSLSFLRNAFGANNFYGGNAPSREWTNQTLPSADHRFAARSGWNILARGAYRTHGDRFVFNQQQPELSDNRHRTHAAIGTLTGSHALTSTASFAAGAEAGTDWVRSTNLGDHSTMRVSAFSEIRQAVTSRAQLDASIRVDRYDEFGTAWSPSFGASWWPRQRLRVRAAAGHAFRVPTFTERYYSDPSNAARAEIGPEASWAGEGGADVFLPAEWVVHATVFTRADSDVIDWLRPSAAVKWQTYNVRDVATKGIETGVRKTFAGGGFVQAEYTGLTLTPSAVDQLSKYVLDYAPRSFTAAAFLPLPARLSLAPRLEYRLRRRPIAAAAGGVVVGGSDYTLVDLRVARRFARYQLIVEGTNLLDRYYEEIAGVPMPGAAMSASLVIGGR